MPYNEEDRCEVWICVDCYFAHHYGYHEHDGKWYAGESDIPADCKPLSVSEVGADLAYQLAHELAEAIG